MIKKVSEEISKKLFKFDTKNRIKMHNSGCFKNGSKLNATMLQSTWNYNGFGSVISNRIKTIEDGYRYGFNNQEKDPEIGEYYAFEYRIHDARMGRFLSVDPLTNEYPWNSPFAFCENRVIDGIDLEGKEYLSIIYKYYYGATDPEIEIIRYDDNQYNSYGALGKGVLVLTSHFDQNGIIISSPKVNFYSRGMLDHGFYYGPTQMPEVPLIDDYQLMAVDAVDEAGRFHDKRYDKVHANAKNGANSWATIEADEDLLTTCRKIHNLGINGIDPYHGQKITHDEWAAANRGILYFEITQWNKIEAVSDWMEKNYSTQSKKGSSDNWYGDDNEDNQRYNYNQFRSLYMHFDSSLNAWVENDGMWKDVGEGETKYRVPKTPDELKQ